MFVCFLLAKLGNFKFVSPQDSPEAPEMRLQRIIKTSKQKDLLNERNRPLPSLLQAGPHAFHLCVTCQQTRGRDDEELLRPALTFPCCYRSAFPDERTVQSVVQQFCSENDFLVRCLPCSIIDRQKWLGQHGEVFPGFNCFSSFVTGKPGSRKHPSA